VPVATMGVTAGWVLPVVYESYLQKQWQSVTGMWQGKGCAVPCAQYIKRQNSYG